MEECVYCKEMCVYCKEMFEGWNNDSLLQGQVDLECNKCRVNSLDIDVFINYDKLELYVDDSSCEEIYKSVIKINYCPICGRRLVK